jgi:hypothetical protein
MKRRYMLAAVCGVMAMTAAHGWAEGANRLGAGAHYWTALDNIDVNNVDENGFSWLVSYQRAFGQWFKLEGDVEWFEKGFGGAPETVYAPQAFALLGDVIYGGVGIGCYYTDGDFANDPFYTLRVGLDIPLLPCLRLDINGNYRFENWDNLSNEGRDIGSDTVTLGAAARLEF